MQRYRNPTYQSSSSYHDDTSSPPPWIHLGPRTVSWSLRALDPANSEMSIRYAARNLNEKIAQWRQDEEREHQRGQEPVDTENLVFPKCFCLGDLLFNR